ncbi:hypothetical protein C8A05DRAFT_32115 [Staphylotrichum tortipilum]|uniref:Phosphoglycerate mutase n=1 Tax=Staphylotrichum tortipilum TaxID=2831512 RepID=A0AAN6MPJ0_9PEZI|nr:hypothetical protein C8A05DRAFT_32115 [Staphylotrichum longicolle]
MRLFLIRHGETVDNVAGVYAGTRDSPLTAHGALQARRLGTHLAGRAAAIGRVSHVFASDLRRAIETAQAVVDAQLAGADAADGKAPPSLTIVQLRELRERDFGVAEGKKFAAGQGLEGAESQRQMRLRAEGFVQSHLSPLLRSADGAAGSVVVVAHGLILDSLLRVLLARFAPGETAVLGDARMTGWSNTGYAELGVEVNSSLVAVSEGSGAVAAAAKVSGDRTPALPQPHVTLSLVGLNVLKHLEGLKKTRGGIGSAQFDKRQRTMDSFFGPATKKARVVEKELEET